jgi:excisionase family DNA binding protein
VFERPMEAKAQLAPLSPLLRPQEAADYLGIKLWTLYHWSSQRKIPVVKVGNRIRFRREVLEQFVKKNERRAIA